MARKQLTNQEISGFCSSLELLLHAGLPEADALYLLAEDAPFPLADLYTQLGQGLDLGRPLSAAMSDAGVFPLYAVGMAQAGERAGRLEEALRMLASYYDARLRTEHYLRSMLTYPLVLLAVMAAVIAVLLIKVLPVFAQVYAALGSSLTGPAAVLLGLGQTLAGCLPVILPLVSVLLLALTIPSLRVKAAALWQRSRGDRGVFRSFHNALFARALAMGFGSGLPLEEAMALASQLLSDQPAAVSRISGCIRQLDAGVPLPQALTDAGLLSASACRMLTVGLRGGNAGQVMDHLAEQMLEEAQDALERRLSRIEPAMVLVCSVLVGAILLWVMLPLMDILSAIG